MPLTRTRPLLAWIISTACVKRWSILSMRPRTASASIVRTSRASSIGLRLGRWFFLEAALIMALEYSPTDYAIFHGPRRRSPAIGAGASGERRAGGRHLPQPAPARDDRLSRDRPRPPAPPPRRSEEH